MSRIGKAPVAIPDNVKIAFDPPMLTVEGPKGSLNLSVSDRVKVELSDSAVQVLAAGQHRKNRAMHGLTRTLIQNMVTGVTEGFTKSLEVVGVGYRVEADPSSVTLSVGYSKPIVLPLMDGVSVDVEKNTIIHVRGIDKQRVGEMAARIRRLRKPEPYRGKGIRYLGEQIRRKVGKAGSK